MKKYQFLSYLLCIVLVAAMLTAPALALEDPEPRCKAAIVVNGDTGEVLYSHNGYDRMYPASTTKIMTSLLVLEALERGDFTLETQVTASTSAIASISADSSTAGIKVGEILTVEQLLYCDMVSSANEACSILAELVGGSINEFAEMMNARAAELGMENSHFVNPHGLHDPNHYTSAYDLYLVAQEAMKHELFRTLVSTAKYVVPATNMSGQRTLRTTNSLIDNWRVAGYTYDKAIGIKTGFTTPAGRCLATAAVDSDGRTFYCIVLGAENVKEEDGTITYYQFSEPKRLLEWAFDSFEYTTIMDEKLVLREVPVTLADVDHVLVQPVGTVSKSMPVDYDPAKAEIIVDLPESVEAPVRPDTVLGTVTLMYEGEELGKLDLVTKNNVPRSDTKYYMKLVEETVSKWWVKAIAIGVVVLIVFLIILIIALRGRSRRNRYSHSSRRRY